MASTRSPQGESTSLRIVGKLSAAFDRLEGRIRGRAYEIFKDRGSDESDSMADWLEAQLEVLAPVELVLKDQKKNVVVEGNLKGFTPKEVEVEVGSRELRVFGSHKASNIGKKSAATGTSSEMAHFFQAIVLPCEVDVGSSDARLLKNGKLVVTLPKKI